MQLLIAGSGALGSLYAAALAPLTEVTMLGHWPEQETAVRESGITVVNAGGRRTRQGLHFISDQTGLPRFDLALVLVKSHQTKRAAQELAQLLRPDGLALTLQNGLGNCETLAKILGPNRAAQGVTSQGATLISPGVVRHAGHGTTILPGTGTHSDLVADLAALLRASGFTTELVADVQPSVWGKLVVNAGINPLTALLRVPNGFLVEHATAHELMGAAAQEAAAVAAAQSIKLPYADPAAQVAAVAAATAGNLSSMLQDVLRGAPTEIDVISGAIVHLGRRLDINTPLNEELWRLVKATSSEAAVTSHNPVLQDLIAQERRIDP